MLEQTIQPRGVVLDLPPDEVPAENWTYGYNVFFRDLATQRAGAYSRYYRDNQQPWGQPIFVYPVQRKSFVQWLIVIRQRSAANWNNAKIIRFDGQNEVTIGTYAYDVWPLDWQATDHNGVIVVNNGSTTPQYWNEQTDQMADLPGWPAGVTCRSIRSFKNHLVALNLSGPTSYPYEYMWSDQSEPGGIPQVWAAGPDNDAGNDTIPGPQGEIVDAINLRDSLMICKDFSSHLLQYIGGTFVFSQRDLYISAGMINPRCGVELNGRAIIMTQDDVIETDGNSMQSICTNKVRRHIFNNLRQDRLRFCQVIKRHLYDEIWVCYGTETRPSEYQEYCNEAAVYNTRTGAWGIRELFNVRCLEYGLANLPGAEITWDSRTTKWDEDSTIWDEKFFTNTNDVVLMATPEERPDGSDESVGAVNIINDAGYTLEPSSEGSIEAEVRREGVRLGENPEQVCFVSEVWPHITGRAGDVIMVQVGGQLSEDEPIVWSAAVPYTIGGSQRKVDVAQSGRLMAFRFYSKGGRTWRMYNFRIRYKYKGRF